MFILNVFLGMFLSLYSPIFYFVAEFLLFSRQEDAQEFLSFVMHQMHEELLKLESQFPNGNGGKASLVSSTNDEDDDDNWETVGPKNKTAITRTQSFVPSKLSVIFGGQLRSVVKARGRLILAALGLFYFDSSHILLVNNSVPCQITI